MTTSSCFFAKLFEKNTDEQLIEAVNNGFDPQLKDEYNGTNFYRAAIEAGSPKLVRACLKHGSGSIDLTDYISLYRPFPAVSALKIAMESRRSDNVEILMTAGAKHKKLFKRGIAWNMRNNLCPETLEELDPAEHERFIEFKHSLEEGTKTLKVFEKRQVKIPGLDPEYISASFFNIDYNADLLDGNHHLPEEEIETFFERSLCDDFMLYPFPCQGTRENALWHYATPKAMQEALKSQDPNTRDKADWTTLHHIAMYGYTDYYFMPEKIIDVLVNAGADVNSVNRYGVTPLMIACARAYSDVKVFEIVKTLIRRGAKTLLRDKDPNSLKDAREWLMNGHSGRRGYESEMIGDIWTEIIKSKIYQISDIDLDLLIKVLWGTPKDIELVLSKGANINLHTENNYTPLMMASVFNDIEAVKFLIERGADVSVKNDDGQTALSLAAKNSDIEKMTLIIENGGDFDALRWVDRNYYTKCTNATDSKNYVDEIREKTIAEIKKFGLSI